MSMKTRIAILGVLAALNGCKTPGGRTSSVSSADDGTPSDLETFFEAKENCQARMGFVLKDDMSIGVVDSTSYADVADLHPGDVVKTLNDEAASSPAQFEELCLEILNQRPALWRYGIVRSGKQLSLGGTKAFECDYLTLVGCGPLPKRADRR